MVFVGREKRKMPEYDTSKPILILVRRGRKGRGFSVSPVEDVSNAAACADEKEIGEVIKEMLDDKAQPRVDINDLLSAAAEGPPPADDDQEDTDDDDDDDEYEDDDEDGDEDVESAAGTVFEGVAGSEDPADRLLFNIFTRVVRKGQDMSSSRVRGPSRGKKRKKKKKKKNG